MTLPTTKTAFLENSMSRWLKALPPTLALAALSIFATSCGSGGSAQARFVNTIPNTAVYGNALDVEVNGTKKFGPVTFPNASASTYTSVASGNDTILGLQTGTTTQVFSDTTNLSSGKQYTLVATGTASGSGGFVALLSISDINTAPAAGNVEFRSINASPSSLSAVDVYIEAEPFTGNLTSPAISALAYTQASSYVTIPWNSGGGGWVVFVTPAGSTTPIFSQTFNFGGQTTTAIRTLVLTDVQGGGAMNLAFLELNDLNYRRGEQPRLKVVSPQPSGKGTGPRRGPANHLSRVLVKRLRRNFLIVEHFKNSKQLGDLEKVADALAQPRQFHRAPGVASSGVKRDQRSESAAIDVIHFTQIQHNLRTLGKQFFDHIAQAGRLFAEHDSTATIHHQHAIHLSSTHSQLHRRFFSDIRSKTQFKSLPRLTRPCKRRP